MVAIINQNTPLHFTIHHINKNRKDNRPGNLLMFKTSEAHKRFHSSNKAWLTYDEKTHLFDCVLK